MSDEQQRSDKQQGSDEQQVSNSSNPNDHDELTVIRHLEMLQVTQMRTYDVLSALLDHFDHEKWEYLSELHEGGGLHNGPPWMNENPYSEDLDEGQDLDK